MASHHVAARRAALGSALVLALWACAELVAWAGLRWIEPDTGLKGLRQRREALGSSADAAAGAEATPEPVTVLHPYLGFVRNPRRRLDPLPDGTLLTDSAVNDLGFPEGPPPVQKRSPGKLVFAILGGSLAMNFSQTGAPFLRQALERAPPFRGSELVFVRLAQGGYKQPQQLQTLSYLLALGAEFDYVIALDGFNEVALHPVENGLRGVFPAYPRGWALRVETLPDAAALARRGERVHLEDGRARWSQRFAGPLLGRSPLANLLWLFGDRRLQARIVEVEEWLRQHRPDAQGYVATGPGFRGGDSAAYEELAAVWRRSALQLHRLSAANGALFLHFLQPNQYVPGTKQLTDEERRLAWDANHPYRAGVERGYPLLMREGEALRREGVRFRDLTPLFRDVEETIYRDRCCHINERGHRLLAGAIAASVREAAEAREAP
jgi:hypothetical protein